MDVLALDIASNLGWCRGDHADPTPRFGSVRFGVEGSSNPCRFAHAIRWAVAAFKDQPLPDVLVIEGNIAIRAFSQDQTARILFGLAGAILGVAYECGHYAYDAHSVRDVRKIFLGAGSLSTAVAKKAAVRRCHQLGWHVTDHDQADACALWAYHIIGRIETQPLLNRIAACGLCVPTDLKRGQARRPRKGLGIRGARGGVLFAD